MRYLAGIESILGWIYDERRRDEHRPQFEYDPAKSEANLEKHGIDFKDVQELWDEDLVTRRTDRNGEVRYLAVGRMTGTYWSGLYTLRGETVRIISARRATNIERSAYDRVTNGG